MEFCASGTAEHKKGGRGGRPPESSGGYPGSDLHLRDVLSVRTDQCAGWSEGEDGLSERPQKIGCYVQKSSVCRVVLMNIAHWRTV